MTIRLAASGSRRARTFVAVGLILMSLLIGQIAIAVEPTDNGELGEITQAIADEGYEALGEALPEPAGGIEGESVESEPLSEESETVSEDASGVSYGSLSAISVVGNVTIPTEQIRSALSIKPGIQLTDEVIQRGANEVFNMGYFISVVPSVSEFLGGVRLTFRVEELPAYRGATFEGNTVFSDSELEALIELEKGVAINRNALDEAFQAIIDLYSRDGYIIALTVADPFIDENGKLAVIVEEGRIGSIKVVGFEKTKEDVIWKEIKTKPGDLFCIPKLQEDARRIYNLRIFEDVAIIPEARPDSADIDVTFEVFEQKTAYFDGAIWWNSEEGVGAQVKLAEDNFLGRAHSAHLFAELSKKGRYYEVAYGAPRLGDTELSLNVALFDTYRDRTVEKINYTEYRKGGLLGLGRYLDPYTSIYGTVSIEDTRNVWDETPPPGVTKGGRTHAIEAGVSRDTRDSFTDPKTGDQAGLGIKYAGGVLGGDFNFIKYNFSFSRLFSVKSGHVFGARALLGLSSGDVPSHELWRIGGTNTVRGIADNTLIGDKMAVVNLEYRVDLAKNLQGVVFVDAGNAFAKGESMSLDGFKMGYGVGVRFALTPGFILRFDYGFSGGDGRLHFSMANLF